MKINELISDFAIYTTNEEQDFLSKVSRPVKMAALTERERVIAETMIRKSLLIKIGHEDPSIVANEY
jgi:hypothetical protein